MVNGFEEEVRALEEYGHDCCARIDDRIHECCKRIREAHEQELDNTRYAYEVSLALMKKQPSPLGDLCGIWKERDGGVDTGGRVETSCGRSDAAADGHMADSAGSQVSEGVAPITTELRAACGNANDMVSYAAIDSHDFDRLCDAIDAVHAGLERENAELRERLAVLDNADENMHDGWSITDELRGWYKDRMFMGNGWQELDNIADRIDAEHESACAEAYGNGITKYGSMVAREYVKLPVDADGVPWHIGDVTESGQTVEAMGLNGHGWHFVGTVNEIDPAIHRHYHAPTVEDVLREMLDAWGELPSNATNEAIVAEYAKRLTLAEGEDE